MKKGLLVALFAALLATPLVIQRVRGGGEASSSDGSLSAEASLERYGFHLREVSDEAGLDFTHQAPQFDEKLSHIMPQVASMGAGVSVVDFDNDGRPDLYVTNSRRGTANALYRNQGDGAFENVAAEVGLADVNRVGTGVSMGSAWGDYDNDGYEDLFLYKWGRPAIFHNDGGDGFTRVPRKKAGLPDWANVNAATWLDYNRDGHLDLFFGGYYAEDVNLWDLETTRIMPTSFEYAQNGGRKYLLRGRGDGTFEDVTREVLGPESGRWTMAASAADLTGNGYPDLFVANDYGVDELFINKEGKRFQPAGEQAGIGFSPKSGMNVAFGDVMNQGRQGVYVTNISEPGVLMQGNNLWVPSAPTDSAPGTAAGVPQYKNLAGAMGVELGGWSYGAQFGDLNNDGALDLFMTNGYVSTDSEESYWYDFSQVAGGNRAIIGDAAHWPAMEGRSLSGDQRSRLWLGDGAGQFREVAQAVGAGRRLDGRAVALADFDQDGAIDAAVAHQRGSLLLYENRVDTGSKWIAFRLEGRASNRSAIGAHVTLHWNNGQKQVQSVSGGSGFCSQNQRALHFGLGTGAQVEKAVIQWPSGRVQTLDALAPGTVHTVTEPKASGEA